MPDFVQHHRRVRDILRSLVAFKDHHMHIRALKNHVHQSSAVVDRMLTLGRTCLASSRSRVNVARFVMLFCVLSLCLQQSINYSLEEIPTGTVQVIQCPDPIYISMHDNVLFRGTYEETPVNFTMNTTYFYHTDYKVNPHRHDRSKSVNSPSKHPMETVRTGVNDHGIVVTQPEENPMISVAIGMGITSRVRHTDSGECDLLKIIDMPFFDIFFPTFCNTTSVGYSYHFFMAYDFNDPLFSHRDVRQMFANVFNTFVAKKCPLESGTSYSLHFVRCPHSRKPAWAQNDAMVEAYLSGIDFFYRINDDTRFMSSAWVETLIGQLNKGFDWPIGVVGPNHSGGNTKILTYDFVHRTHVDIFGFYYPRVFVDWNADDWISKVYMPGRAVKVRQIILDHHRVYGTRYKHHNLEKLGLPDIISKTRKFIERFHLKKSQALVGSPVTPDPRKVIAMSLCGDDPSLLWGAVRNAQLRRLVFPDWTLRYYVICENEQSETHNHATGTTAIGHQIGSYCSGCKIPMRILHTLKTLGAEVKFVRAPKKDMLPLEMLKYLVLDDHRVELVLFRSVQGHLNERDATLVADWLKFEPTKIVHTIQDHESHFQHRIQDNLWGANAVQLRRLLQKPVFRQLGDVYNRQRSEPAASVDSCLSVVVWRRVRSRTLRHTTIAYAQSDMTSSERHRNIPHLTDNDYIGAVIPQFCDIYQCFNETVITEIDRQKLNNADLDE